MHIPELSRLSNTIEDLRAQVQRLEDKLDELIDVFANAIEPDDADDDDPAQLTLDGQPAGAERAKGQPL